MATLIFDIETVGEKWESLDGLTQKSLTRWVERGAKSETERKALLKDIKEGLGFSPLTGQIVALGLYDLERRQGAVYYIGEQDGWERRDGEYVFKACTEKELLEDFWEGARSYDTFVTFNGRAFDVPFILHRSVVNEVTPTVDLMENRFMSLQKTVRHVDLQDQLTFYGAMQRRPSLHLFCRAYGIETPKSEEVAGDDVAGTFLRTKISATSPTTT